jgi:hypothetical protein
LHHFWEALHLIVVLLGLILAGVISARLGFSPQQKPLEVKAPAIRARLLAEWQALDRI